MTTLGSGVDNTVLQLAAQYEVRGMISGLTSYASATPNSGPIVNDVQLAYNEFGQTVSDAQSHSGAVVLGTTPMVQYGYFDGSTNTIRPQTLTYPNGRVVTIGYGASGGINDSCSRVDNLSDSSATLVNYAYLGLGTPVQVTYPEPGIQYTLLGSTSGTSPAGDIYWGLDLFSRIIDSRWFNTSTNTDVDRIQYGYDRASNRLWRKNPVATAAGAKFDEFYVNDGLHRLKQMQRGTLNSTNTGITSPTFGQCWTLDPTGNWMGFNEEASGGSWTTTQTRTANPVNEITAITNTVGGPWASPDYDAAGNMTTMPQPASPGDSYTATYDAWNRMMTLSSGDTVVQTNQYDARTFRTVRNIPSFSETRHFYFTHDWRDVEERVGTSTAADRQFIWGVRYSDDLVLRDYGSQRLYAAHDANWNLTSLIDATAAVQERYAYSAYGDPTYLSSAFTSRSGSSYAWETLYCGYRFDVLCTLYVVRRRILQSFLGCWIQRDPHNYSSGPSLYSYVNSTPLSRADYNGLDDPYNLFWGRGAVVRPPITVSQQYQLSFSSAFGIYLGDNPGARAAYSDYWWSRGWAWGSSAFNPRQVLAQGCVGITGCMLGREITGNDFDDCYTNLAAAITRRTSQNAAEACSCDGQKNQNGRPAQSQVFAYTFTPASPPDGGQAAGPLKSNADIWDWGDTNINRGAGFDFSYYDAARDAFWHATTSESDGGVILLTRTNAFPAATKATTVYCVTCEGNGVLS